VPKLFRSIAREQAKPEQTEPNLAAVPHLLPARNRRLVKALAALLALGFSAPVFAASLLDAVSMDFTIMSPDGRTTLGHGRYTIDREKNALALHGESRYTSGEYDLETDLLSPGFPSTLPTLEKFDRIFYSAQGTVTRSARADLTTAYASCTDAASSFEEARTLDFPSDTWAGASVLIPIQHFLQNGGEGELLMNVFNCTSKPAIYEVIVSVASQASQWPYSPSDTVQVDVKPHFGWFDVLIAPWMPKLNAWFDPETGWALMGVAIARYYKGPQVLIVTDNAKRGGQPR